MKKFKHTVNDKWSRQRRAELRSNTSDAEKVCYRNLVSLGYTVVRQKQFVTQSGKVFFADLYIPKLKLVVEVDGGYHYTATQKRLDANRSACLRRLGVHVYRLSNRDARSRERVKNKIRQLFI